MSAALGREETEKLLGHGLLVRCAGDDALLCAPVQIYPLPLGAGHGAGHGAGLGAGSEEAWIAADWDLESLLPSKWSVMPVGVDSLELALAAPRHWTGASVLDLCCGSGVQAIVAGMSYASRVVAVDLSPRAVRFCAFSVALSGLPPDRVQVLRGDLFAPLAATETFDIILCNPPFVAVPAALRTAAPHAAWAIYSDGGEDGTRVLRRAVAGAAGRLRPSGWLMMVTEIPNIQSAHRWLSTLPPPHHGEQGTL